MYWGKHAELFRQKLHIYLSFFLLDVKNEISSNEGVVSNCFFFISLKLVRIETIWTCSENEESFFFFF